MKDGRGGGRKRTMRRGGNDVGHNELLAKIVARALGEYPYMNSQLVGDETRKLTGLA
jgi:hypothetical protein